jgi:two-component system cell cycle sensor histidine kinase/response regulator CckA
MTDFSPANGNWNLLSRISPELMSITDRQGKFIAVNPAWETLLGWSEPDLLTTSYLDLLHPENREQAADELARLRSDITTVSVVHRCRCANGSYRWVSWSCAVEPVEGVICSVGREVGNGGSPQEITNGKTQRNVEEALRKAYETLNSIIAASPHAIIAVDKNRNVRLWNPAATEIFGWTDEEVIGNRVPFVTDDQRDASDLFNARILRGESLRNFEVHRTRRDGSVADLQVSAAPTLDENGEIDGFLTVATDVTEHRKLEQQFLRTQRLESLGTLAGGIAHDLNNVLSPIQMSLELFRMNSSDPRMNRMVETLDNCVQRAAGLIRQILTFARGVQGERAPIQTLHLLREIEKVMIQTLPKAVTVTSDFSKDLWTVSADATQLHQVVMNLWVNSRDAMPDGGTLTINASNMEVDETYLQMAPGSKAGPYVCIEVRDTGSGIPKGIQQRIFEPFFTTKEVGKGTGIGLSTVAAIIKSHDGFINVYSEVGRGTSFKVYLPALPGAAHKRAVAAREPLPVGAGELVLIVDDEAAVREIAKLTLETHGYRVVEAQDGAEGVARYAQHLREVRLVISDMDMPVMNGAAMIRSLERINPDVRVISASGLIQNGTLESSTPALRRSLPKPYTAEQLLHSVRELLDVA